LATQTGKAARPKVGLALAGGGFLGATYELGALAALSEAVDGLDLCRLDSYVGVSAGGFIAACLANGITVHEMVRMYVEADDGPDSFNPARLLHPDWTGFLQALGQLPSNLAAGAQGGFRGLKSGTRTAIWRALEKGLRSLPIGLLDSSNLEKKLSQLFEQTGRSNDFRKLKTTLRIVATDVDLGEPVEFGAPGHDQVAIAKAVSASSAVPGLFKPVTIAGRSYVDGALTKTLHASVALNQGAKLVICVNPLVPYGGTPSMSATRGAPAVHTDRGAKQPTDRPQSVTASLSTVLRQTIRTVIRSRMSVGLEKYKITHPQARIVLLEPSRLDADTFFTDIFSLSGRRRLCEHAYLSTRADLLVRYTELAPSFAKVGLKLNRDILRQEGMSLVRADRNLDKAWVSAGDLGRAQNDLGLALDDLQRYLKLRKLMA
jgi:NTE family protein